MFKRRLNTSTSDLDIVSEIHNLTKIGDTEIVRKEIINLIFLIARKIVNLQLLVVFNQHLFLYKEEVRK